MPKKATKKPTRKKAPKQAIATLAAEGLDALAAVAHTKCFTDPSLGERWSSFIPKRPSSDGAFTIGDGSSFRGHHSFKGDVHGHCLGDGMEIWTDDGAFYYKGQFTDEEFKHIEGKCFKLLQANLVDDGSLLVPGDPWEADKET